MPVRIYSMSLMVVVPLLVAALSFVFQPETGSIEGTVTDQWSPISEASITARNVMTGVVNRVNSDPVGYYSLPSLRQGHYTLWVEAVDHESLWLMRVFVERGRTTQQDIYLKKRPIKETLPEETLSEPSSRSLIPSKQDKSKVE